MASSYKVAFFDVDGTLLSFKTHAMPASTKRALTAMRENGVKLVVCSGRSLFDIPAEVLGYMDAVIAITGQLCLVGDEVVRSHSISAEDVRAVVDQVEAGLYDAIFMLRDRQFVSRLTPQIKDIAEQVNIDYRPGDLRDALEHPVYQICAFIEPGQEELILSMTKSVFTTRWSDLFCDLVPIGGGKDQGVRAMLERFGCTAREAIGFGDGENDISMFEVCGTSVAMGNARPVVQARATYVTSGVDEDGIWNAAVHFGLI